VNVLNAVFAVRVYSRCCVVATAVQIQLCVVGERMDCHTELFGVVRLSDLVVIDLALGREVRDSRHGPAAVYWGGGKLQYESKKSPLRFSDIFPKRLGIFNQCLTHYLHVHIYA